jgi:hypothetical protein
MANYSEIAIARENKRLYSNVVKMSNSPQYAYLGLNMSSLDSDKKKLEAGLTIKVAEKDSHSWISPR